MAASRPTGTVTFPFTDVVGQTGLWDLHPARTAASLKRHDEILRATIVDHGGYEFSTQGDAFVVAFQNAGAAFRAAIAAQQALAAEDWPRAAPIRVRMGLHTGSAVERGGDYFGPSPIRAAREMALARVERF